ncbi:MAG: sigma-70 family RNA polymerase sigma factor [Bacteroidetes bacterium]|nr:sigma-70 family RNA polymerase sigma factor [Bacteroidota bacterium]
MAENSRSTDRAIDESALVALLRARDRSAVAILYDRYAPALYGVLERLLRSHDLAEDALQETLVKVWGNFESYDPEKGRLFTWLVRVARNIALDIFKSKGYRNTLKNQELESLVDVVDRQSSAGDDSDRIGLREIVLALKPEQQEVIDLIYFRGYTQDEASKELGIPLGTVKTRVRSALLTIRKIFS